MKSSTERPRRWSKGFKRQLALLLMIGASPLFMFVSKASDVPPVVTDALIFVALPVVLAGGWFVVTRLRSAPSDKLDEREQQILWLVLAFVVALVSYNIFMLYTTAAARS
jgi:hypothetical protein